MQLAFLFLCAVALGVVALRAPERRRAPEPEFTLAVDASGPATIDVAGPAGFAGRSFDVGGMCCNGCPRGIYEHLRRLPEVVEAAVSFKQGTASALVPLDFPSDRLVGAIASEKYVVTPRAVTN